MNSVLVAILDNGMGLSRTAWACSMFDAAMCGVFNGRKADRLHISYPYPNAAATIAANYFLRSGYDDIVFIDTDIVFDPVDLARLLSHDLPYVGGIVPKRTLELELAIFPYEPLAPNPFAPGVNPLIDSDCGRGFVKINRSVFELLKPHVPTYFDDQEQDGQGGLRWEFFQSKPGGHSEDFRMCEIYRSLGGKPVVDQRILTRHIGSAEYPLQINPKSLAVAA